MQFIVHLDALFCRVEELIQQTLLVDGGRHG
jgi:hypothetical protein